MRKGVWRRSQREETGMEKFTVMNNQGRAYLTGASLREAAQAVLEYDDHQWKIQLNAAYAAMIESLGNDA
jgi:hypothetical protein